MNDKPKLILVLVLAVIVTAALLPFQLVSIAFGLPSSKWIPVYWHRIICRAIGVRVQQINQPSPFRPLLLVSNHVSWSDIIVLGRIAPLTFVAKHEVSRITGANLLAWLQRTVFVVRERKSHSASQAREITDRLLSGEMVVLFAEGTTGDGNHMLHFKSALLGSAQYAVRDHLVDNVQIQPVAIRYVSLHGLPIGRRQRAFASWIGDEELGPHLSRFVALGHWNAQVIFGEPISFGYHSKRREVMNKLQNQVRNLLSSDIVEV